MRLRNDALQIAQEAVESVLPEQAVRRALQTYSNPSGRTVVISIGKAAWRMASAAQDALGEQILRGLIVTKYGHNQGELPGFRVIEAGHPVPDQNSILGAKLAIETVRGLSDKDAVLLLLSGGGSSLFELPAKGITLEDIEKTTRQLLDSGETIVEMNTIRKRLSAIKGGKFTGFCAPAKVYTMILSDVVGDQLDSIASGPTVPDTSTCFQAARIAEKYDIHLCENVQWALMDETPKRLDNIDVQIIGNVSALCKAPNNWGIMQSFYQILWNVKPGRPVVFWRRSHAPYAVRRSQSTRPVQLSSGAKQLCIWRLAVV